MAQFYALQVLLQEIAIDENVPLEILPKNIEDIKICFMFAHFFNTEIQIEDLRGLDLNKDPVQLELQLGKSVLFSSNPKALLVALTKNPLELWLKKPVAPYVISRIDVEWNEEFQEVVKSSETQEEVLTAFVDDTYTFLEDEEIVIAYVKLAIKIISYGPNIQTQFQIVPRENVVGGLSPKKYFFTGMDKVTVFKVQLYPIHSCKPTENNHPVCPCKKSEVSGLRQKIVPENLTKDQLNKILCCNKHCLGAKDFARFGIGPRAAKPKTDGLHEVVMPFGMCHVYGPIKNYGPESTFLRPRTVNHPFVGKHSEHFSSPEYIEDVMKKPDNIYPPCICTCCIDKPDPITTCWNLLESYNMLINSFREMRGIPPLDPLPPPICENPDCPMKRTQEPPDFTPCKLFLGQNPCTTFPPSCSIPNCPFNVKPPCNIFYESPLPCSCPSTCSPSPVTEGLKELIKCCMMPCTHENGSTTSPTSEELKHLMECCVLPCTHENVSTTSPISEEVKQLTECCLIPCTRDNISTKSPTSQDLNQLIECCHIPCTQDNGSTKSPTSQDLNQLIECCHIPCTQDNSSTKSPTSQDLHQLTECCLIPCTQDNASTRSPTSQELNQLTECCLIPCPQDNGSTTSPSQMSNLIESTSDGTNEENCNCSRMGKP